jgi:AcrR family transcriptional regulator
MARKTKEEAKETYDRILEAAADVFYQKGVSHTTLEDIASAANVTRGAIYWHFKNKQDLFSALHSRMHSGFMDQVLEKQSEKTEQPLEQLAELCVEILSDFQTNEDRRQAVSIFTQKCDYTGDMKPLLDKQNEGKRSALAVLTEFFERAVRQGSLPVDADGPLLARSLSCYMAGIMIEDLQHPAMLDLQTQALPMIKIFFKGIAP